MQSQPLNVQQMQEICRKYEQLIKETEGDEKLSKSDLLLEIAKREREKEALNKKIYTQEKIIQKARNAIRTYKVFLKSGDEEIDRLKERYDQLDNAKMDYR